MVRGAALALVVALAWACDARASVLVPTYVLPPDSFARDQRSLDTRTAESQRTIKRLIGGHMKIKPEKEYGTIKNSLSFDAKSESGKFAGVIADASGGTTVGWNQGVWDDGMLMSSAGEGKDKVKAKEDDEDKKTLSDQVAEGKYGLIQNEIFSKEPKRPGIVSYAPNSETRAKDNIQTLGGLKKDEIWLAEDHLLVLKGGSFPERTKESDRRPWPPIDAYEAPRRQVKLPQKPKVPPPFPVRLSDDGPLVFLTPNGSVPAPYFPPFFEGPGDSALPPPPFAFAPGAPNAPGDYPRNSSAGGASLPIPPFPFLPGNASEGAFPFLLSMNASFPEGFPPGAAFLPPPSNQSDLYDEDDPSIYYPPPYNFSYRADYNNSVPAGPLVPGIILPPPPDFFAPLEEKPSTTTEAVRTTSRPTYLRSKPTVHTTPPTTGYRNKYKTRPTTTTVATTVDTEDPRIIITTTPASVEIITTPKTRKPVHVVEIPQRKPVRVHNLPEEVTTRPKTEKPVYKTRQKVTSKPLSVSVLYDYPEQVYDKQPKTTENPYIVYVPEKAPVITPNDIVTSTVEPWKVYNTETQKEEVPTTKLQPVYSKPTSEGLASFYFFDEQTKASPSPNTYFVRDYYNTNQSPVRQQNVQTGFAPSVDVTYGSLNQDSLFLWPQKQGPRTLTQEYFSIQKPRQQNVYIRAPKQRDPFYQQIADIQSTIDLFTTKRPKDNSHRAQSYKPKAITSRPVYQFSYQAKPKPEQLSFRAPKLDPEPFRPMVSYSKPFNIDNEFNAIASSVATYPDYWENVQETSPPALPTPARYYTTKKPTSDTEYYYDALVKEEKPSTKTTEQNKDPVTIVHRVNHPSTTPSPINHGYYTKQDERYLDDITKNSFDIFGKKLEDNAHDINGLAVTPPLGTVRTPINNNINLQYAYENNPPNLERDTLVNVRLPRPPINPNSEQINVQNAQLVQSEKPPSLAGDTLVNDRYPRPPINPDSEFIPIPNPGYRQPQQYRIQPQQYRIQPQQYRIPTQVQKPQYTGEQYDLNQPSLGGDIAVNYKRPLPPINPDAEWIAPVNAAGEGRPGSFVSYRLPGEGAHVYFLTPQAAQAAQAARERYRTPGQGR